MMSPEKKIARRAAIEIKTGELINLGFGIPLEVLKYLPKEVDPIVHAENGLVGMGEHATELNKNRNLTDAAGLFVTEVIGASVVDLANSFALIGSGRVSIAFLGGMEVSQNGDLANWIIPGKYAPGIGGATELAQKAQRVIVLMTHTTKNGSPKIREKCSLPLTAPKCVDTIITELAVMKVTPQGLELREISLDVELDEVVNKTEATIKIAAKGLKFF